MKMRIVGMILTELTGISDVTSGGTEGDWFTSRIASVWCA